MAANKPNAGILLNDAPIIIGATPNPIPDPAVPPSEPVVGLPLSLFTMVFNQQLGVLANAVSVLIDPPPREDPGPDPISIALWLNGRPLEERQIPDADRDQRTSFNLFESSLLDNRNNKLEYKVRRPSDNVGDSIPLWLLYSAELPGGNIVPGNDDHPYLEISLPAELGDPPVIGKDEVDKGVPVTLFYPYMKAYDVITLRLQNNDFALPPVLPEQVGQPQVVTIIRDVFEGVGSDPQFQMSYTVVDQLKNPTEKRRWSKKITADVDVDRVTLVAPDLAEDPDDPSDDPNTIDLSSLGQKDLTVLVHVFAPLWQVGDVIRVLYSATPPTGTVANQVVEANVIRVPFTYKLRVDNAKVLPDSVVRARYELVRNNGVVATSRTATAQVIGVRPIELNPPVLQPPASNPIDPLVYPAGVNVSITFAGQPGDRARLQELNPPPGAAPFPDQDLSTGQASIPLTTAFLVAREGQNIGLRWALVRGGVEVAQSLPLSLTVNRLIEGDPRLPTPVIPEAGGRDQLDLSELPGDASITVQPWVFIAVGQVYDLSVAGTDDNGASYTINVAQNQTVTENERVSGVNRPLLRSELNKLANGSNMQVKFEVRLLDGSASPPSVSFPQARLLLVKSTRTEIDFTDFENGMNGWTTTGAGGAIVTVDGNKIFRSAFNGYLTKTFQLQNGLYELSYKAMLTYSGSSDSNAIGFRSQGGARGYNLYGRYGRNAKDFTVYFFASGTITLTSAHETSVAISEFDDIRLTKIK